MSIEIESLWNKNLMFLGAKKEIKKTCNPSGNACDLLELLFTDDTLVFCEPSLDQLTY